MGRSKNITFEGRMMAAASTGDPEVLRKVMEGEPGFKLHVLPPHEPSKKRARAEAKRRVWLANNAIHRFTKKRRRSRS